MRLTDEQWSFVEPKIPRPKRKNPRDKRGRPRVDARAILDGILWILWTGARWKALPREYPPYQTVHRRLQEWNEHRVFWNILKALAADLRDRGKVNLTEAFVDGTYSGAKRGDFSSELLVVGSQPRSWQSSTLEVFRSPLGLRVVRAMKRSSWNQPSDENSSLDACSA